MKRNGWMVGVLLLSWGISGCSSKKSHENYRSVGTGGEVLNGGVLLEARDGHAVAPVDSGQLLIVGGATGSTPASDSLERYDPSTGWSEPLLARLDTPRVGHQAIALPDGRVWILGGADANGQLLDSTELFDPTRDALQPGPRLQHPRAYAAAAISSTQLLLAGGTSSSVEVWDLTALQPAGPALTLPGREQLRGSLARAGAAWILAGARDDSGESVPPLWIDLAAGVAELASERFVAGAPAVTLHDASRTFLIAGRLDERSSAAFQRVERGQSEPVFDDGYRVLEVRDFPSARATEHGVLVLGGVAVFGPQTPLASVEWVTPKGSNAVSPLAVARRDAVLTPLADGRVVISGGSGVGGRPVALVEVFVPANSPAGLDRYAAASQRAAHAAQQQRDLLQAQAEVARLTQALTQTQQQLAQTQLLLAQAQTDLNARTAQVQSLSAQVVQLTQALNLAQQAAQAANGKNQALQGQVNDLTFRLQRSKLAYDQAVRDRDTARNKVSSLQQDLKAAQAQIQALQAQLAARATVRPGGGGGVRALPPKK